MIQMKQSSPRRLNTQQLSTPSSMTRSVRARSPDLQAASNSELIALLIGRQPLSLKAQHLALLALTEVGSLGALSKRSALCLANVHGLSLQQAERLWAAFEIGRRAFTESLEPQHGAPLDQASAAQWARARLAHLENEEVWVLCLGAQMRFISAHQVGKGGMHACALLTRDVLVPVLRSGCQGFILIHNHPSGSPEPSTEDFELTRALEAAASSVCVPLIDHLIVAKEGCTSFHERGFI